MELISKQLGRRAALGIDLIFTHKKGKTWQVFQKYISSKNDINFIWDPYEYEKQENYFKLKYFFKKGKYLFPTNNLGINYQCGYQRVYYNSKTIP